MPEIEQMWFLTGWRLKHFHVKPPAVLGVFVPSMLTCGVCVPPQWVPRWAEPCGCASLRRCPHRGPSPASWRTCRGPWWASAWACWSCAATKRVCRSNVPGGSSSSPSSPSSSSPSSGTSSPTSCWGCRSHPLPDEGPPLPSTPLCGPPLHLTPLVTPWTCSLTPNRGFPSQPSQNKHTKKCHFCFKFNPNVKTDHSNPKKLTETFSTDSLQIKGNMSLLLKRDYSSNKVQITAPHIHFEEHYIFL